MIKENLLEREKENKEGKCLIRKKENIEEDFWERKEPR